MAAPAAKPSLVDSSQNPASAAENVDPMEKSGTCLKAASGQSGGEEAVVFRSLHPEDLPHVKQLHEECLPVR